MASRDVVLRRWEHSTGRSGASGACGTVVRNLYLTYLTTKQPCFHSFPCRVAPKRPLVYSRSVSRDDRRRVRYESRRHSGGAEEAAGGFICVSTIRRSRISILPGPLSSSWVVNSRHDARATYTAKPQTTAQLEAASSWTREAGGASRAIVTVPAMRPRALLGASCESNGSKEKTLKSGVVGSRALAGQRLKQADFTFQDPSRGSGTTTHVPSADPRTLQLHLRDFPFSPPPPPLFAPLQARTKARRRQRAHTILHPTFFTRKSSLLILVKKI